MGIMENKMETTIMVVSGKLVEESVLFSFEVLKPQSGLPCKRGHEANELLVGDLAVMIHIEVPHHLSRLLIAFQHLPRS